MSRPAKIGPWGGSGGQPRDLHRPPNPSRLVRVIVTSREVVYSIKFNFVDTAGVQREEGPWGGTGGDKQPGIELSDSDHIVEVSGTVGPYADVPRVITYLKFVTKKGDKYEYGNASAGTSAFHIPLEDGQILGFFGRDGDVLDAIGFYIGA
ncbi:hypothetical protein ACP4OV_014473 [Aristida adscensionis]